MPKVDKILVLGDIVGYGPDPNAVIARLRAVRARAVMGNHDQAMLDPSVLEWFNPECPFVKKHYGSDNMQKLQQEYTSKGVVWLSIDSSAPGAEGNLTPEQAKSTINSWKTHQTALLLDPEGKAGRAFGAKNTPHMFVINPEGKVVYEGAIDSKATPNPADIPSSTNYVKSALDESLAGKPISNAQTKPYGCSVKYKSS